MAQGESREERMGEDMRTDIDRNDLAGKHDWDGKYDPSKVEYPYLDTFSVGIFRWVVKSSGNGVKRGKAICRVRGWRMHPQDVYSVATRLCQDADRGVSLPKTYHV